MCLLTIYYTIKIYVLIILQKKTLKRRICLCKKFYEVLVIISDHVPIDLSQHQ